MWHDLWVALALMMVIEGILPFVNPAAVRKMLWAVLQMNDHSIRVGGLITMLIGVATLYLVN